MARLSKASPGRIGCGNRLGGCWVRGMTASDDLLRRIENDPALAELLVWPGDFDIGRRDPVEDLRLPTGVPLYPVAGCGAG